MPILDSRHEAIFSTIVSTSSNPGAGNEADMTLISYGEVELLLLSFLFTADANAASRILYLEATEGSTTYRLGSAAIAHTASTAFHYICHQNANTNAAGNSQDYMIPLPFLRFTDTTPHVAIKVTDIQVGDAITDIQLVTRTWRTPT